MKDYYKILGLEEEASEEAIRARCVELTNRYRADLERGKEPGVKIEEIDEALEVLTDFSKRLEYDYVRNLKQSVIKTHRRRERKFGIRKIILPVGIPVLFLIFGIVVLRWSHVAKLPKSGVPYVTDQGLNQKVASPIPPGKPESKAIPSPPSPPIEEESKPKEEPVRNIPPKPQAPVKVGKEIPKETVKVTSPENVKSPPQEIVKIDRPKPVVKEPQPAPKPEAPVNVGKEIPKEAVKVTSPENVQSPSQEIVRIDRPKPVVKEPQPAPKPEAPVNVGKEIPKEAVKVTSPENVQSPSQPQPAPKPEVPVKPEPDKPERVVSLTPPLIAKEEEVKQFFSNFIDRYNRRDIGGFLSFFSSKAIQNQKDGLEGIRSIYTKFFDQSQELRYRLESMKIEIYQNSVEVRARFRVDQTLKKRGEEKIWKGDIRWVLVKEDGNLKISSLDYQNEKSP